MAKSWSRTTRRPTAPGNKKPSRARELTRQHIWEEDAHAALLRLEAERKQQEGQHSSEHNG